MTVRYADAPNADERAPNADDVAAIRAALKARTEADGAGAGSAKGTVTEDPAILLLNGALDTETLAKARREQQKLRAQLLGAAPTAQCALSGRDLPTTCLRAAHIKRRSVCTDEERLQLSNVMLACTLGCDHLFELGLIHIDCRGTIRATAGRQTTRDLDILIAGLDRGACAAYSETSAPYFAWHREQNAP